MSDELTPERIDTIKSQAMTMQTVGGLWVTAEDYADLMCRIEELEAQLEAADALAQRFEIALTELDDYNVEISGENYNSPKHNAALTAYREARK